MDDLEIFNINSYYNAGESDADFYEKVDFLAGVDDIDDYKLTDDKEYRKDKDGFDFLDQIDFFKGVHDDDDFLQKIDDQDKKDKPEVLKKQSTLPEKKVEKQNTRKVKKEEHKDKCRYWLNICCVVGTLCLITMIFIFSWKLFGPKKNTAEAADIKSGAVSYDVPD